VSELKVAARSHWSSHEIPLHTDACASGLLGGSFTAACPRIAPSASLAIKRLQADRVWWLVDASNPLKAPAGLRELDERTERARKMASDPRIDVSCLDPSSGTRYTEDTIKLSAPPLFRPAASSGSWALTISRNFTAGELAAPRLSGADGGDRSSAASFRALAARSPRRWSGIASESCAGRLRRPRAPAWVFLTGMKSSLSSTGLRNPDGSWATQSKN